MALNYRDLPPKLKAQVDKQLGKQPSARRTGGRRAKEPEPGYRCRAPECGRTFDHWGVELERHRDATGHHGYAMMLDGDPPNHGTVSPPDP